MLDFDDHLEYFNFIGQIIGKAIYDGILAAPQFANFFLRILLGKSNHVDDLASLDPTLYKNLLFLKTFDGDFADLGLYFSHDSQVLGETVTTELVPGGGSIAVTRDNRMSYIYRMADHRLNRQLKMQSQAFINGMRDVLNNQWLRQFTADELALLISVCAAIILVMAPTHMLTGLCNL